MRNFFHCSVVILSVGVALGFVHSCVDRVVPTSPKTEYVTVVDSAKIYELRDSITALQEIVYSYENDSSITEEVFVLRFKLERIKYYYELAGKGNNAKFFRGWVGRVVNE